MAGLELKYFTLKPRSKHAHDPYAIASRMAMSIYANNIHDENPELATALLKWVHEEATKAMALDDDRSPMLTHPDEYSRA